MTHSHARTHATLMRSSPHSVQADDAMSCPKKNSHADVHPPSDWMSEEIEDLEMVSPRRHRWSTEELQPDPIRINYRRVFNCGGQCLQQTCPDMEETVNKRASDWDPKFNLSLHNQILFDYVSHHFLEWHCVRLHGAGFRVMSIIRFRSCPGHRVHIYTEKPGYSHPAIHDEYFINTSIPVSDYGIIVAHDRHCLWQITANLKSGKNESTAAWCALHY